MIRKYLFALGLIALCSCQKSEAEPRMDDPHAGDIPTTISEQPVNPHATPEALQLYKSLKSLYGKKALSGVVANVDWNTREAENVHKWTGK